MSPTLPELARLSRLLDASLDLAPAEQERFLAELGPDDQPLRETLQRMLAEARAESAEPGAAAPVAAQDPILDLLPSLAAEAAQSRL